MREKDWRFMLFATAFIAVAFALTVLSSAFGGEVQTEAEAIAAAVEAECAPAAPPVVVVKASVKGPVKNVVDWKTEAQAWATPGPLWLHFTDAPYCGPCVVVSRMHHDPRVVEASKRFACASLCWCDDALHDRINQFRIKTFPTDIFVSTDRKTIVGRVEGWAGGEDVEKYLLRFEGQGRAGAAGPDKR